MKNILFLLVAGLLCFAVSSVSLGSTDVDKEGPHTIELVKATNFDVTAYVADASPVLNFDSYLVSYNDCPEGKEATKFELKGKHYALSSDNPVMRFPERWHLRPHYAYASKVKLYNINPGLSVNKRTLAPILINSMYRC